MKDINTNKVFKTLRLSVACTLMALSSVVAAQQVHFENADQAANAFVVAVARDDEAALSGLLGADYRDVLSLDEIGAALVPKFLDAWISYHTLVPESDKTRMLAVGETGWTLPLPIVREADGWRFDLVAGEKVMRIRRIGRNELSAIEAVLAYHDAQIDYAGQDRDGDGVLEYAQHFISSPGQHDGLYWPAESDQDQSPLGPLLAEQDPVKAYHGYYYRILKAQGEHAPGGAADYVENGNMTQGFAIIAWPAEYGESGVMSFMLNREGVVYEADLGPDGAAFATSLAAFDPDSHWAPTRDSMDETDVLK